MSFESVEAAIKFLADDTLVDISPQENAPFDHYFDVIQKGARVIGIVIFWLVFGFLLLIKPHAGTPSWMRKKIKLTGSN